MAWEHWLTAGAVAQRGRELSPPVHITPLSTKGLPVDPATGGGEGVPYTAMPAFSGPIGGQEKSLLSPISESHL